MKNLFSLATILFVVCAISIQSCAQEKSIVSIASETADLSTLVTAVKAGELVDVLSGEGPFTVFAPTNAAFEALPDGVLDNLLKPENKETLQAILKYHVVAGSIMSTDLKDGQNAETVQGEAITVNLTNGVKINNASVVSADIKAANGVVHVIDQVILPPSMLEEQTPNIVDLAVATPSLSTLVAAVKAGGLVETLQGEGPFTVFAPTDEAFAALPEGTLASLLKPENKDQLVSILTYHVVAGKVLSTDLKDGMEAKTVQGESITIDLSDGAKVNGAVVAMPDVMASNGVVHVINKVILPPSFQ